MQNKSLIRKIGNGILDLVYPPGLYCISCGKITDDSRTYRLCNDCMRAANWAGGRHCEKCGRPLSQNDPGGTCFSCAQKQASGHPNSFDRGYACAGYGAVEQSVIFAFKYGGRSDIGDTLGGILYDRMIAEFEPDELAGMYDIVLPVPIHRDKKSRRGFNHADLMAESFARRAGLPFDTNALIRTRHTLPMKGLGPQERAANVKSAFDIRPRKLSLIAGANILLIDDIFTTGATIDEIAAMLKHPRAAANGSRCPDASDYHTRHEASDYHTRHEACSNEPEGASRVDFLAFAAAGDMIAG